MNPFDDFSDLRPDVDPPSAADLEAIWERATSSAAPVADRRPRRWAVLGAVASIAIGVTALAIVGSRADAPAGSSGSGPVAESDPADSDTAVPPESTESAGAPGAPSNDDLVTAAPLWALDEPGWAPSTTVDRVEPGGDRITLVAGPDGVDRSWVAVVDGMSEPLVGGIAGPVVNDAPVDLVPSAAGDAPVLPPTDVLDPDADADADADADVDATPDANVNADANADANVDAAAIRSWRGADDRGSFAVSSGGVARAVADRVAAAIRSGSALPDGFEQLADGAGVAVQRRITYRFEHADGRVVTIDVQAGGEPWFDLRAEAGTGAVTALAERPAGVDDALVLDADGSALLLRTGFWVSTVRVADASGGPGDRSAVAELAGLLHLAGDAPTAPAPEAPARIDTLAVGDSVMLGAATDLNAVGIVVDAVESRAFVNGLDLVREIAEQDRLPRTLVVHLGTNGPIGQAQIDEFVDLVADVDRVILLTLALDRDWVPANNELIFSAAGEHDNIDVLDWSGLAADCPGDCVEADGFHLKPDGREYYVALIRAVLDEPSGD